MHVLSLGVLEDFLLFLIFSNSFNYPIFYVFFLLLVCFSCFYVFVVFRFIFSFFFFRLFLFLWVCYETFGMPMMISNCVVLNI